MKDFDFEELDRAVSSAIGRDSSPASREREAVPADRTPPAPATRRAATGRFMDIMPPASSASTSASSTPEPAQPAPTPEKLEQILSAPAEDVPEVSEDSTPIETPFISDAVVEKRPLGGPSPSMSAAEDELLQAEMVENSYAQTPKTPSATIPEPQSTAVSPVHAPQKADEPAPRSIYDTETFAQPAAVKKKKSGLWIALWIVLLVLLGAGAGAAVYFFILQPL